MRGKLVANLFIKKQIEHFSGSTVWNVILLFLLYVQVEVYQNIWKLGYWPLAWTLCKAFLKNKKRSGSKPPTLFSIWFLKKKLTKCHCLIVFNSWDISQYVFVIISLSVCDVIFLKLILAFLSSRFPIWTKNQDKNLGQ